MKKIIIFLLLVSLNYIYAINYSEIYRRKLMKENNSPQNTKKVLIQLKNIINNFYKKGRFTETVEELNNVLNELPKNLQDDALYYLAKSNYKIGNLASAYLHLENLINNYQGSSLIKNKKIYNTFYKMIDYELNKKNNISMTFVLKMYLLLKKSKKNNMTIFENLIKQKYNIRKDINIDFTKQNISNFKSLKFKLVNFIWLKFFPYLSYDKNNSFQLENTVSIYQINKSFNHYVKKLMIKLNIKNLYETQVTKYYVYGSISTSLPELLNSLGLRIEDLFNNNTDKYNYKDEF